MTAAVHVDWVEANQQYLAEILGQVAAYLDRLTADDPRPPELDEPHPRPSAPEGVVPSLRRLADTLGLTPFEELVVAACAGVELDSGIANRCAVAHDDPDRRYATFGLLLAALPDAHWTALNPAAPLRRWRLVELHGGGPLTTSQLRIDEWALHYLVGVDYLDERLAALSDPFAVPSPLQPSHQRVAEQLRNVLLEPVDGSSHPVVCLAGRDEQAKRAVAGQACAALGLRLVVMSCRALPADAEQQEGFLRLWARQAALGGAALLVDTSSADQPDACPETRHIVEAAAFPLMLTSRDSYRSDRRPVVTLDVSRPTRDEQCALWKTHLDPLPDISSEAIDTMLAHFDLNEGEITAAAQLVHATAELVADTATAVWDAARCQRRSSLSELATRIVPAAGWDDLVLPEFQKSILRDIVHQVRHRDRVYREWGFGARMSRGMGVSALFVGRSGTGKTTAAEVLAGELRLDLYRIDLSQVVSKYIGETEKNLRRVFDAAEDCGAILLFDEADALFGKRSEVRDSHDRYANIEISYLLQRMETYRGLAILTTNMEGAIDQAFMRRLRFVVEFGFPDREHRNQMWRQAFPAETPVGELSLDDLSRLNLTGGNIHNIALGASFMAASDDEPVDMGHIVRAARAEYVKLGRPVSGADIRRWS